LQEKITEEQAIHCHSFISFGSNPNIKILKTWQDKQNFKSVFEVAMKLRADEYEQLSSAMARSAGRSIVVPGFGDSTPMSDVTVQAAAVMVGLETLIIIARAMMAWLDNKEGAKSMPADVVAALGSNSSNNLVVGEVVDLNNAGWHLQLQILLTPHLTEEIWFAISVRKHGTLLGNVPTKM
jgi:hypothetical protein